MPIHMHFKKGRRESGRFRYYFEGSNPPSPLFSPHSPSPAWLQPKKGRNAAGLDSRRERNETPLSLKRGEQHRKKKMGEPSTLPPMKPSSFRVINHDREKEPRTETGGKEEETPAHLSPERRRQKTGQLVLFL